MFKRFSTYVVMIHQHYRQTDGQMTCDSKTALCTVVHRAVKTEICRYSKQHHTKASGTI